jgi:hypothetical protein
VSKIMKLFARCLAPVLVILGLGAGCEPAYVATAAPPDLTFDVTCETPTAGAHGKLSIDISFAAGQGQRSYGLGCEQRAALAARLKTIEDLWCTGTEVPPQQIGGLVIGTTTSELSNKRGATIDDGQGYVAFLCGDWLSKLIGKLLRLDCCGPLAQPAEVHANPGSH